MKLSYLYDACYLATAPYFIFFLVCLTNSKCRIFFGNHNKLVGIEKEQKQTKKKKNMVGNNYSKVEWMISHAVSSTFLLSHSVSAK